MAEPMSCEQRADLLALDAVGALEPEERAEVERHLATCATCRPLAAQYADAASLLPAALPTAPPPARLRQRLMAEVYGEAIRGTQRPWWRRLAAGIPANRAITAAGALALAAAVALAIWGISERHPSSTVAYEVSGTTAQPSVMGTLVALPGGTQSILTVHGLTAPPNGEVYEVWLVPTHGSPRGVAFLSPAPSGGAWTAVVNGSLAGYQTIAATNEPRGGSPGPTGTEVLSGQLGES